MNWEVFKRQRGRLGDRPTITIDHGGSFRLSAAAWRSLGSPTMVELLYAEDEGIIGLRASDAVTAFVVTAQRAVSARAFLAHYGISTRSRRWPAFLDGDVLCIDLTQPGEPVTSNAKRKRGSNGHD